MNTRNALRLTIFTLLLLVLFTADTNSFSHSEQATASPSKPIVIKIERRNGRPSYIVESKITNGTDMLGVLAELFRSRGRECTVIGLVDNKAAVMDIDLTTEFAGKVGFVHIYTFIVNKETGKMAQVKLESAVPISNDPLVK
jgi:hypothetical protein